MARWQRITGWCGIFSFLLMGIAFFLLDPNLTDSLSPAQFVDRAIDNDALRIFNLIAAASVLLWLWFAAGMRERLAWGMGWSPLRAIGWAGAIGGSILLVMLMLTQGAVVGEARGDGGVGDEFARNTFFLLEGMFIAAFAFFGMWMFASGIAAIAWGGVPKWWAWPATLIGTFTIIVSLAGTELTFLAFALWWLWSMAGAVWLAFAKEPTLVAASAPSNISERSAA